MLISQQLTGLVAGGLMLGGAVTAWASTLNTDHSCSPTADTVTCTSQRGAHWPLLMGLGIAQIAGGALLLRGEGGDGIGGGAIAPLPTSSPSPSAATNGGDYGWIDSFKSYGSIMIIGGKGSGKSTFVKWLAEQRQQQGDRVLVFDPHAAYGDWDGLDVIGRGKDYAALTDGMTKVSDDIDQRYAAIASEPNPTLPPVTLILEEMTGWAEHCDKAVLNRFDTALVADARKAKYRFIKISHNDTLSTTGGRGGTKKTQESNARLYLNCKPDPTTPDGVSPAFTGTLIMPGGEPQTVKISPEWRPARLGSAKVQQNPVNPPEQSLNPTVSVDLGNLEPYRVQVQNLEKSLQSDGVSQADKVRKLHSQGLTQDQIILAVYGATKGGSAAYKNARDEYRKILNLGGDDNG